MDAVEFIKTRARMCRAYDDCKDCSLCNFCEQDYSEQVTYQVAEQAIAKVEQWAKKHPVKTRQGDLLKMFPSALTADGVLCICPRTLDLKTYDIDSGCIHMHDGVRCKDCRRDFWLKGIE